MTGNNCYATGYPSLRDRDARVCGHGDRAGNSWDDLEGDSRIYQYLRLLASTTKHEWVAPFQAHNNFTLTGLLYQDFINLSLRDKMVIRLFAYIDQFCLGRICQQLGVGKTVMHHNVGFLQAI